LGEQWISAIMSSSFSEKRRERRKGRPKIAHAKPRPRLPPLALPSSGQRVGDSNDVALSAQHALGSPIGCRSGYCGSQAARNTMTAKCPNTTLGELPPCARKRVTQSQPSSVFFVLFRNLDGLFCHIVDFP
jgi:hypothetical protein